MYDPDRPSDPAAGSDATGPPDWFAACALPDDEPVHDEPVYGVPDDRVPADGVLDDGVPGVGGGAPGPGLADVPGLRTAAQLPSGRRRRRTALTPEPADSGAPRDPAGPEGPEGFDHPDGPFRDGDAASARRAGRRRRRASADDGSGEGAPRPAAPARDADGGDPAARARDICLRLLTGTARTRRQLADALRKREIPDDVAEEVLSRFEEVGLIDDAAFAEAWVDSRQSRRGLARRALGRELRTRGVSGDLVEAALARVDPEDEAVAARALVDRRLPATRGLDAQARTRRLVAMLARRGYGEGLAFRVVREALGEEGEGFGEDW